MSAPLEITYDLSPMGQREILERRALGCERQPHRTCAASRLAGVLGKAGLPLTDELLDLELNVGGWCAPDPRSLWGLGLYLSLEEGTDCHAIATRFRKRPSWFAGDEERGAAPLEWSYLPLRGTGYPRAFFGERALVPMGMTGEEHVYFLGKQGEVYVFLTSQDQLSLVAGSGRTLIERWGMSRHKQEHSYVELHVCADVATLIAEKLDVPLFEPACDQYFQVWANDSIQLRLVHDVAPNVFGTHVAAREPEQLLRAVRSVMASRDWPGLRVWAGANNVDDLGGRSVVASAGIELEVLFGPGPGNFEFTIDPDSGEGVYSPSTYDSSNWR